MMFSTARTIASWIYWGIDRTNDTPLEVPGGQYIKHMADRTTNATESIFPYANWQPTGLFRAFSLVTFTLLPLVTCLLISQWLQKDIHTWYKSLNKPLWAPTKWLLSPGWSLIYILQGYAGWRVWSHGGLINQYHPMLTYMTYMLANSAWKPVLFKAKKMDLSFLGIVGTLLACSATIRAFSKVDTGAAYLLIPDWIYLVYATFFVIRLLQRNPQKRHLVFQQSELLSAKHEPAGEAKPEEKYA
jgi:tryptophan-rich sensory protein